MPPEPAGRKPAPHFQMGSQFTNKRKANLRMKKQPIVVIVAVLVLGIGAYFIWLKPRPAPMNPAPDAHEEHKGEAAGEGLGHEEHKEEIVRINEETMREFGVET